MATHIFSVFIYRYIYFIPDQNMRNVICCYITSISLFALQVLLILFRTNEFIMVITKSLSQKYSCISCLTLFQNRMHAEDSQSIINVNINVQFSPQVFFFSRIRLSFLTFWCNVDDDDFLLCFSPRFYFFFPHVDDTHYNLLKEMYIVKTLLILVFVAT